MNNCMPISFPDNLLLLLYRNEQVPDAMDASARVMFSGAQMQFCNAAMTSAFLDGNLVMQKAYQTNGFNSSDAACTLQQWNPTPKAESGVNWGLPLPSRKRCRDCYVGESLSSQMQRHQSDVDWLISRYMENVRMYAEQKSKIEMRRWAAAVECQVWGRVRAKEEEIERMGKMNRELEERIKSLCRENQMWKDTAREKEAEANSLEEALAMAMDRESSCGSVEGEGEGEGRGRCWECGKEGGARVVALPCRHLCLCQGCDSSTRQCPVCTSPKDASLLVN